MRELAILFLKLGAVAFGGPAAHIGMMEAEVVSRRGWLTHEHFLDLVSATNLIPGPNSTEMAAHIGYVRAGFKGLMVAGLCFILPAVIITLILARLYVLLGTLPVAGVFMWGVRPAVIAIIISAVVRLGRPIVMNRYRVVGVIVVAALSLLHIDEIVLLLGSGIVGFTWTYRRALLKGWASVFVLPAIVFLVPGAMADAGPSYPSIGSLGLYFLKIGSVLYGSGYVLVAFLQDGLVEARHWLTQSQLLDAIAVGQFTPGPVLSSATFIGYLILGWPGAVASTLGIFLPSFIFVLILGPFVPKLRRWAGARGFLDGVNVASLGLMTGVCVALGESSLRGTVPWLILIGSAVILIFGKIQPGWIVLTSALIGWVFGGP